MKWCKGYAHLFEADRVTQKGKTGSYYVWRFCVKFSLDGYLNVYYLYTTSFFIQKFAQFTKGMSIAIKDVVALTGVSGLFQIIKSDERAIVVESLDDRRKRQLIRGNMMVSKLMDISIYTDDESEPLVTILQNIKEKFGSELPVTKKSKKDELMDFLEEVLPNYDKERVYPSNVKKMISWYKVLDKFDVDLEATGLEGDSEGEEGDTEKETEEKEEA
jgi:hypothetical protein